MNRPKRTHYLPESYLRRFCRNGILWVFDREEGEYRPQTPRNTALQRHYYPPIIESLLSDIEGGANPIASKIDNHEPISLEEKEMLSLFIAFLKVRVPDFEKFVNGSYEKVVRRTARIMFSSEERIGAMMRKRESEPGEKSKVTPKELMDFVLNERYDVVPDRNESLRVMLSLSTKFANLFRQMEWFFLCSPEQTSFITTDNPFTLVPPLDSKSFYGVGIATEGAEKLVPLSQESCLMMCYRGDYIGYRGISRQEVHNVNLKVAANCDRFVIGCDEASVKDIVKTAKIGEKEKTELP